MYRWKKRIAILMSLVFLVTGGTLPCKNGAGAAERSDYSIRNTANEGEVMKFYVEDINAEPGSEIKVPVKIRGNTGIMGFGINVKFDGNILEPVSVIKGELLEGTFDDNIGINGESGFDVLWSGTDAFFEDGIVFEIVYKVSEYAKNGLSEISISYSQEDTFDGKYGDVKLDCENAGITIEGEAKATQVPTTAPTNTPGESPERVCTVYADTVTYDDEDVLSVPVKLKNNTGLMGFMIQVKYDAGLLEPFSVEKGDAIPDGTTFDDNCELAEDGTFRILWAGTDETKTNGCLFTLHFRVKEKTELDESLIELSYKREDTFDGNYMDAALDCEPIKISASEKPDVTGKPDVTDKPNQTENPGTTDRPNRTDEPNINQPFVTPPAPVQTPVIAPPSGTPDAPSTDGAKPAKVKISKVKYKSNKSIEIRWKKQKNIEGYQLQYSLSKKFKPRKVRVLSALKVKTVLKKLKSGKSYYIRIRSYRFYRGKKLYGGWSRVKKCKVK